MKAIDKKIKSKSDKSRNHVHKFLVEHPSGHHILTKTSKSQKVKVLADLIQLKESKNHKNKSGALLISGISLCLSLLFVIGMFEWRLEEKGSGVNLELSTEQFEVMIDVPQTQQIQKPPLQVQSPQIIEVKDEEIIEEIEVNLDIEMTEDTRIEEVVFVQKDIVMQEEKVDEIFTIVQEQPLPVGGIRAFYEFVGENLNYPSRALRMGLEGRVFVEFVVEKDGSLSDIKVVKGIGGGCDDEAIRVISQAPKWNPGKQRGNAVRVRMVLPIMFKLLT